MACLSVKTLGAFSNWREDLKIDRQGRNPSVLMSKIEIRDGHLVVTTDRGALIA